MKQVASCEDAGTILRGQHDDEAVTGKDEEALITRLCVEQKWPRSVIECVARSQAPQGCLEELDPDLRGAYADAIDAWRDEHGGQDEDVEQYVSCDDAVKGVEHWPPASTATGDDLDAVKTLRADAMRAQCDIDGWPSSVRACIRDASPLATTDCLAKGFDFSDLTILAEKLTDISRLMDDIAKAKKNKPATYACKAVVATHYDDAAWKGKLVDLKAAERTKIIKASRTKMLEACTRDAWSATARACVVAKGGDRCFLLTGTARWGFPAPGVLAPLGVASCDAYAAAVMKLSTCDKLPQQTRDALVQSLQQTQEAWQAVPPEGRTALDEACRAAKDAIDQAGAACK